MAKKKAASRKKRAGRKPLRLKLEGPWTERLREMLQAPDKKRKAAGG